MLNYFKENYQEDQDNTYDYEDDQIDDDEDNEEVTKPSKKAKKAKEKKVKVKKAKKYGASLYMFMLFFIGILLLGAIYLVADNKKYHNRVTANETKSALALNKESSTYKGLLKETGLKDEELVEEIRNIFFKDSEYKDNYFTIKANRLDKSTNYYIQDVLAKNSINPKDNKNKGLITSTLKKYRISEGIIKVHAPKNYTLFKALAQFPIHDLFQAYDLTTKKGYEVTNEKHGFKPENETKIYPLYLEEVSVNTKNPKNKNDYKYNYEYKQALNFSLTNLFAKSKFESDAKKRADYYLMLHAPRDNEYLRLKFEFADDQEWTQLKHDDQVISVFPKNLFNIPEATEQSLDSIHKDIIKLTSVINLAPDYLNNTNFKIDELKDYFFRRTSTNANAADWYYLSPEVAYANSRINRMDEIITTEAGNNEVALTFLFKDKFKKEHILTRVYYTKGTNMQNIRTIRGKQAGAQDFFNKLLAKGNGSYLAAQNGSYLYVDDVNYDKDYETTEWRYDKDINKDLILDNNKLNTERFDTDINFYAQVAREYYNVRWYLNKEEYDKDQNEAEKTHAFSTQKIGRNQFLTEASIEPDLLTPTQRFHYFYHEKAEKNNTHNIYENFNKQYNFTEAEGDISFIGFISSANVYKFNNPYQEDENNTKALFYYKPGIQNNELVEENNNDQFDEAHDQIKDDNTFIKWLTKDNYQGDTSYNSIINVEKNDTLKAKVFNFYPKFEYKRYLVNYYLQDKLDSYEEARAKQNNKLINVIKYTNTTINQEASTINWYVEDKLKAHGYYSINGHDAAEEILKNLAGYVYDQIKYTGTSDALTNINISSENDFDQINSYDFYLKRKTFTLEINYSKRTITDEDYLKVATATNPTEYETINNNKVVKSIKYLDNIDQVIDIDDKRALNQVLSYKWTGEYSKEQKVNTNTNAILGSEEDDKKVGSEFSEKMYEYITSNDTLAIYPIYKTKENFTARLYVPKTNYTSEVAINPEASINDTNYLNYFDLKPSNQSDVTTGYSTHTINLINHPEFQLGGQYQVYNLNGKAIKHAGFYLNPELSRLINQDQYDLREDNQPLFARYYYPINVEFYDFKKGETGLFNRNQLVIRYPGERLDYTQTDLRPLNENSGNTLVKYYDVTNNPSVTHDEVLANTPTKSYETNHLFAITDPSTNDYDFKLQGKTLKLLASWDKVLFQVRFKLYYYHQNETITEEVIKNKTVIDATTLNPNYKEDKDLLPNSVYLNNYLVKEEELKSKNFYRDEIKNLLSDYAYEKTGDDLKVSTYYKKDIAVYFRQNIYKVTYTDGTIANNHNVSNPDITNYYVLGQKIKKEKFPEIKRKAQKPYAFYKNASWELYTNDDLLKSLFNDDFNYLQAVADNYFKKNLQTQLGSIRQDIYQLDLLQLWETRTRYTARFKQVFLPDNNYNQVYNNLKVDPERFIDPQVSANFTYAGANSGVNLDTVLRGDTEAQTIYNQLVDTKNYNFKNNTEGLLYKPVAYKIAPISSNLPSFNNINELMDATNISDFESSLAYEPNNVGENSTAEYVDYYIFYKRSINVIGRYTELGITKEVAYKDPLFYGEQVLKSNFNLIEYTKDNQVDKEANEINKVENSSSYTLTINDQLATTKYVNLDLKYKPAKIKFHVELATKEWCPLMSFNYKEIERVVYRELNNTLYNGTETDLIRSVFADVKGDATYYVNKANDVETQLTQFINDYSHITEDNDVNSFISGHQASTVLKQNELINYAKVYYRLREYQIIYQKNNTDPEKLVLNDPNNTYYDLSSNLTLKIRAHYNLKTATFKISSSEAFTLQNIQAIRAPHERYFEYFYNTNQTSSNFLTTNDYQEVTQNVVLQARYTNPLDSAIWSLLYDQNNGKAIGQVKLEIVGKTIKPVDIKLDDPDYGELTGNLVMSAYTFNKIFSGYDLLNNYDIPMYQAIANGIKTDVVRYYLINYQVVDEENRLPNNDYSVVDATDNLNRRYLRNESITFPGVRSITIDNYQEKFLHYEIWQGSNKIKDINPNEVFNLSDANTPNYKLTIKAVYRQKIRLDFNLESENDNEIKKDKVATDELNKLCLLSFYKGDQLNLPENDNAPLIGGYTFDKYLVKSGSSFGEYLSSMILNSSILKLENGRYTLTLKVLYKTPYDIEYKVVSDEDTNQTEYPLEAIDGPSFNALQQNRHKTLNETITLPQISSISHNSRPGRFIKYRLVKADGTKVELNATTNIDIKNLVSDNSKTINIQIIFKKHITLTYKLIDDQNNPFDFDKLDSNSQNKLALKYLKEGDVITLPNGIASSFGQMDKYLLNGMEYNPGYILNNYIPTKVEDSINHEWNYNLEITLRIKTPYRFNYHFKLYKNKDLATNHELANNVVLNQITNVNIANYLYNTYSLSYTFDGQVPGLVYNYYEYEFVKYVVDNNDYQKGETFNLIGNKEKTITFIFVQKLKVSYQLVEKYAPNTELDLSLVNNPNLLSSINHPQSKKLQLSNENLIPDDNYRFLYYEYDGNTYLKGSEIELVANNNNTVIIKAVLLYKISYKFYYQENGSSVISEDNSLTFIKNNQLKNKFLTIGKFFNIPNTIVPLTFDNDAIDPNLYTNNQFNRFAGYTFRYKVKNATGFSVRTSDVPAGNSAQFSLAANEELYDNQVDIIFRYYKDINLSYKLYDAITKEDITEQIKDKLVQDAKAFLENYHFQSGHNLNFINLGVSDNTYHQVYYKFAGSNEKHYIGANLSLTDMHNGKTLIAYFVKKINLEYMYNNTPNLLTQGELNRSELNLYKYQTELNFDPASDKFSFNVYKDFRKADHTQAFYYSNVNINYHGSIVNEAIPEGDYHGTTSDYHLVLFSLTSAQYNLITKLAINLTRTAKYKLKFDLNNMPSDILTAMGRKYFNQVYYVTQNVTLAKEEVQGDIPSLKSLVDGRYRILGFKTNNNDHTYINYVELQLGHEQVIYVDWEEKLIKVNYKFIGDKKYEDLSDLAKKHLNQRQLLPKGNEKLLKDLALLGEPYFYGYYIYDQDSNKYKILDRDSHNDFTLNLTNYNDSQIDVYIIYKAIFKAQYEREEANGYYREVYRYTYIYDAPIQIEQENGKPKDIVIKTIKSTDLNAIYDIANTNYSENINNTLKFHELEVFDQFDLTLSKELYKTFRFKQKTYKITYQSTYKLVEGGSDITDSKEIEQIKPFDIMPYEYFKEWIAPGYHYQNNCDVYYELNNTALVGSAHYISDKKVVLNNDQVYNLLYSLFYDDDFYQNNLTEKTYQITVKQKEDYNANGYKYGFYDYYTHELLTTGNNNILMTNNKFSNENLTANYQIITDTLTNELNSKYDYDAYLYGYDKDLGRYRFYKYDQDHKYLLLRYLEDEGSEKITKIYLKLKERKYKVNYLNSLDSGFDQNNITNNSPFLTKYYNAQDVIEELIDYELNNAYLNFKYYKKNANNGTYEEFAFNTNNYQKRAYEYGNALNVWNEIYISCEVRTRRVKIRGFRETYYNVSIAHPQMKLERKIINILENISIDEYLTKEFLITQFGLNHIGLNNINQVYSISIYERSIGSTLYNANAQKIKSYLLKENFRLRSYLKAENIEEITIDLKVFCEDTRNGFTNDLSLVSFFLKDYNTLNFKAIFNNMKFDKNAKLSDIIELLSYIYDQNGSLIIANSYSFYDSNALNQMITTSKKLSELNNIHNFYYKREVTISLFKASNNQEELKETIFITQEDINQNKLLKDIIPLGYLNNNEFYYNGKIIDINEISVKEFLNMEYISDYYQRKIVYKEK